MRAATLALPSLALPAFVTASDFDRGLFDIWIDANAPLWKAPPADPNEIRALQQAN